MNKVCFAKWADDPTTQRALEQAAEALCRSQGRRCSEGPTRFEKVCLALSTAGLLLCAAGFVYLVWTR